MVWYAKDLSFGRDTHPPRRLTATDLPDSACRRGAPGYIISSGASVDLSIWKL